MKRLAWLLLCTAVVAQATPDNPCNLPSPPPPMTYSDMIMGGATSCAPKPFDTGTVPSFGQTKDASGNLLGVTVWWYCPLPDGSWGITWRSARADVLGVDWMTSLISDLAGAAKSNFPAASLNGITQARVTLPMNDPSLAAVWCPRWPDIYNGRPAAAPSVDGTLVPPTSYLFDSTGVKWAIDTATGFATRDGMPTNGHATAILLKGGTIYVKSPTGGFWWKWTGPNTWLRLTTTQP